MPCTPHSSNRPFCPTSADAARSRETQRYSRVELGLEWLPPSVHTHVVLVASVPFWSPNPCKGSSQLSRADGIGSTSSISSLPIRGISAPEQGCVLPQHCKNHSKGTEHFTTFLGGFPIFRVFDGSFPLPPPGRWFCEWAVVTGSGRGKGADGERWPEP